MRTNEDMIQNVFARRNEKAPAASGKVAVRLVSLCVALAVFVAAGIFTIPNFSKDADTFIITVDVNPSLQLKVENEKVSSVEALNTDADKLLEGIDCAGKSPEEAAAQIAEELYKSGYISAEANSVLVSVEGKDDAKGAELGAVVSDSIQQTVGNYDITPAVVVQTVSKESGKVDDVAAQYGISHGKAQLIHTIIGQNSFLSYEELAKMSIHELNVLRISNYIESDAQEDGAVSLVQYITEDAAKEIALNNAEVKTQDVVNSQIQLDCHNATIVYTLEFEDANKEYRYRINAVTSEIVSAESSDIGKNDFFVGDTPVLMVGETKAIDVVTAHAGATNPLTRCKLQRDWVEGRSVYKIYFSDGSIYGNYVVDAKSGEILKYSKADEPRKVEISETVIGEKAAKTYALAKNGLVDGNISKYHMTLAKAEEQHVYTLEYICDGYRYETTVNAADGTVISNEKINLKETGRPSVEQEGNVSKEG